MLSNPLEKLRKDIDVVDRQLVALLVRRFSITRKIGIYKAQHCLPVFNKKREAEIIASKKALAKKLGINELLVEKIFRLVIANVKKEHNHAKIKL